MSGTGSGRPVKHSVTLRGHRTSISLEPEFWEAFRRIAATRARIAQAEAGTDIALANFDQTVLVALQETETALSAYANELDRRAALTTARNRAAAKCWYGPEERPNQASLVALNIQSGRKRSSTTWPGKIIS